jgi:hypothetical protein
VGAWLAFGLPACDVPLSRHRRFDIVDPIDADHWIHPYL